ncbi:hypothetical protein KQH61_00755 [bacterium]|nr:hypothetical protein [bacterium]
MKRLLPIFLMIVSMILTGCGGDVGPAPTATPTPSPDITVCASGCDFVRIQEAVDAASTQVGAVIGVLDSVHTEAGIVVGKSVTIQGNGADATIVQGYATPGEGVARVFEIPLEVNVTIRGLTIQNGNPTTSPLTGGGVLNYGTLLLESVVVRNNYGSAGGGLYSEGILTAINTTITDNGSVGGGDAYLECETGGGMKVITGTTTLINSTVSNNRAKSKGGGVHVACEGTLILRNSTVSNNFATESGGGVYLNGSGDFENSTISENSASNVGGIALNGKDDIHDYGHLRLVNTIVANNVARIGEYGIQDCNMEGYAAITDNSYSWVGDGKCEPAFSGDPMLGPLGEYGGPTETHSLLPGSPVIDVIPSESCLADTDQRGEPRGPLCDIGAFELQTP